jgi:hypothetical protein
VVKVAPTLKPYAYLPFREEPYRCVEVGHGANDNLAQPYGVVLMFELVKELINL